MLARACYRIERLEHRRLLAVSVVDFTQGANGDATHSPPLGDVTWINGILNPNNSEYFEGVSTLQRVFFDGIVATSGNVHTLTFDHQAGKGGVHAYDFMTSWQQALAATNTIAPGTLVNPYTDGPDANTTIEAYEPGSSSPAGFANNVAALHGVASAATPPNLGNSFFMDVNIPDNMDGPDPGTAEDLILNGDSVNARIAAYESFFGTNRTLRIYGNSAISAASLTFTGYTGTASDPKASYTLNWTSPSTRVVIEFGAHLAQGQDFLLPGVGYGAGEGAGSISGGPYHVTLDKQDNASLGSQDNQIQANAVSAPPSFTIDKTGDTISKVGDAANYTITINNNGALPMFAQSISDSLVGSLSASSFTESGTNNDILDVGETWTRTYSRTVQSGDPDPLTNTVTAVFDTQSNLLGIELTHSDSHTVNLFQPSITLDKTVNDHLAAIGDTLNYTITVTNTSSADSPNLVGNVVDPLLGINQAVNMAPGAVVVINASHVVTSSDPDPLNNTATVTTSPAGFPNVIAATDNESVNLFQPSFTIDKTGDTLSKVGDPANYTITVTNTSSADTPTMSFALSDSLLTLSAGDSSFTLAPGASKVVNASRTVQAGDPDPLVNTATATATISGESFSATASDSHSVNLFQPSIAINKTGDTLGKVGDPVDYTITVTNTSSADSPNLVNVTLTDTLLGNLLNPANPFLVSSNADGALTSGEVWTITARRTVQAGDADPLPNTATVHANPQGFPNDITASDGHSVNLFQPSLHVVKSGDTLSKVGDPVNYSFAITNNGSADSPDLVNVSAVDSLLGNLMNAANPFLVSSNADGSLSPGETWTIAARRTVQAGDADPLPNTVTVSGVVAAVASAGFAGGNTITPDASSVLTHSVNLFQPAVDVAKSIVGNPTTVTVGDTITYRVTITNTSSSDSPVLVPDSLIDTKLGTLAASAFTESGTNNDVLDVGETWTGQFNYLVLASDVPSLTNVVTVHYHPQGFPNDITDTASVTVPVQQLRGRIAPTGTTPQQFIDFAINGTGGDPGDDDGFADGGFNYTASGGKITNVSDPGIAFYYTVFTAPSNSFSVQVAQTATNGGPEMNLNALQVLKVVGSPPNATGVVLVGNFSPFPVGTDPTVTLNAANLGENVSGQLLVLRWRVEAKSIEGKTDPGATYRLDFKTLVNSVQVDADPNGILVIRSPSSSSAAIPSSFSSRLISAEDKEERDLLALLA